MGKSADRIIVSSPGNISVAILLISSDFLFVVATSLPFSYIFCSGQSFLSFLTEKIFTIGLDQTRASSDDAI